MKNVKIFKSFVIFLMAIMLTGSHIRAEAKVTYQVYYKGHRYTYTGKSYKVYYNNELVNSSSKPAMKVNDNIMIPYYYSLVERGPKIKKVFNKSARMLSLMYGGHTVKLYLNKNYCYKDGVKKKLNTAPFTANINGKSCIMIPGKAVIPALGLDYKYDKSNSAVYISSSGDLSANTVAASANGQTASTAASTKTASAASYTKLKASSFKGLTTSQFINKLAPAARQNYKETGVLASVTLAQAILESGWGKSVLAQKGNNMFGMKAYISGNTWKGTTWDGKSTISKKSGEEYKGRHVIIKSSFRKYSSVYKSIQDHSAYLCNAKKGSGLRYAGLKATKSYVKQINIIKKGGYATSSSYGKSLLRLIRTYNLARFDK